MSELVEQPTAMFFFSLFLFFCSTASQLQNQGDEREEGEEEEEDGEEKQK